jgi:hypothetical protein
LIELNRVKALAYCHSLNRYDNDEVLKRLEEKLHEDEEVDYLRLRVNGVDLIKSHGVSEEQVMKEQKHWNSDFIKLI